MARKNDRSIEVYAKHLHGALKADTLRIRTYAPADTLTNAYAQHWSAMTLEVDKLGRRTKRTLNTGPTQRYVYEDSLGVLLRTIDSQSSAGGDTVRFTWDAAGRLLSKRVGALPSETFTYDTLGNLAESNAANRFFNDYEYDARGKQTLRRTISALGIEYADTTRTSYDGFGAVIAREQFRPYGGWNTFADEYQMDGLGNILAHDSNRGWSSHRRRAEYIYAWERLTSQYNEPLSSERQPNGQPAVTSLDDNSYSYDQAGNTILQSTTMTSVMFNGSYDVETPTFAGASRARHYYDATNRLRHVERWFGQDSGKHTIQEYRYDALGRRVLLRTRKDSLSYCGNPAPQTAAKCLQTIDRFFWDGDQLLLERRRAGRWDLPLASLDSVAGGTGAFFGEVRYVHAIGIDDPLIVRKSGHAAFAPLRSGRGGYETGLYLNGTLMTAYHWPGKQEGVYPGLDGRYPETADLGWFGSLLDNKRDASGMIYMRNRYYDPGSGRFTQRDPIGLAGGVNQYGYAGGDPVNFSDPFGLCPEEGSSTQVQVGSSCFDGAAAIGMVVGGAVGAIGRGVAMLRQAVAARRAQQAAAVADDVAEVHGALDPVAQSMRTTAVLESNGGRIAAGGARDLTPAQRSSAASRGIQTAAAPGVHAEQTALQAVMKAGFKPDALAVSRPMCSACQDAVRASGGQVTSPTSAIWP